MRKIRDVLRLTAAGMSSRLIAASLTIGATTVIDCLGRARRAGIVWPLPDELSDETLESSFSLRCRTWSKTGGRSLTGW
jgi:DNA-binding transcriptional regulator LsrR (DeoR family)